MVFIDTLLNFEGVFKRKTTDILIIMLNTADWVVLILGVLAIWLLYKKLVSSRKNNVTRWNNREDLKTEVRFELLTISAYKSCSIVFSILWVVFYLNSVFFLMETWVVLIFFGLAISWTIFVVGGTEANFYAHKLLDHPKDLDYTKKEAKKRHDNSKSVLVTLLLTSIVAGNWAYEGQKEKKEDQEIAISRVLELPGLGWCGNFEDISWNGEEAIKSGGWPCIYVANVESIEFSENKGKEEMCIYLSFNAERGLPGDEAFSLETDFQKFCTFKSVFGEWSTYDLEDDVGVYVRPKLNDLVKDLCEVYAYRLTQTQYYTYCTS